jgi:integrase
MPGVRGTSGARDGEEKKMAPWAPRLMLSIIRAITVVGSTPQHVTVRSPGPRDYLTEREVEKLMDAARDNRWGHRDATAILLAYRHGLRASELVALRWDDINLQAGKLHVRRVKGGETSVHPLRGSGATCPASPAA